VGKPLSTNRKVFGGITNLTQKNWGMPWEENPLLVMCTDRDLFHNRNPDGTMRIDIAAKARTRGYVYGP
jgi:hypothetical protein